jgi:hypothetical protein
MALYKYRPIDLDRPAIRLLRLLRGNLADDIHCHIFNGWLNQSGGGIPYDALSYTWGTTEKLAKLIVNGGIIYVTFNLYTALQHLRFEDEDRILWIDAICIDQDNIQERRHQVQQMGRIYKAAERVVIWLGQGTKETDLVMDFMKQLHDRNVSVEGDWRPSAQIRLDHVKEDQIAILRDGMEVILTRSWFRRIWILQEIAHARVAIIHCGKKSVSARTFAQVPSLMGIHPHPNCQAVLDIMPGISREESWWSQQRNLHTLLVKFRESEASDERDIIYALQGISSDGCQSDVLVPDYTKSIQEVIRETISFLLSPTNRDRSLYQFLDWTLPEFLQRLDTLGPVVLESACERGEGDTVKLLLQHGTGLGGTYQWGQIPLSLVGAKEQAPLLPVAEYIPAAYPDTTSSCHDYELCADCPNILSIEDAKTNLRNELSSHWAHLHKESKRWAQNRINQYAGRWKKNFYLETAEDYHILAHEIHNQRKGLRLQREGRRRIVSCMSHVTVFGLA